MATADFSSGDSELDRIIAEYIEAIERGEKPDVDALLLAHPEHREALRQFVDDYHRLGATNVQPFAPEASSEPDLKDALAGTFIAGRYKLIENIGEGGMGSVWVAEQKEPVKRKVAIKLIKAGMDSKQVLARFEAERQALALMDHPNIARVFDGGMTEQGRPFFVMEYVKGIPFTDYCDKARLSLKERLELFIPVCQAVQHAHHKGIVHRDLKPSNILICLYDGKPVPKVIDFGLAKAMHQQLTELSLHTAHGVMVGTPIYMSPEQAELNNLDVDTRTDIYSLGVVLYELLTGTTPLGKEQLRRAAYDEILKLIKEAETPRPSTRLSGHESLPNIAAQRSVDPRSLQKTLSGDLDWIVMKSLEKERSRRYETANGLSRDVERFLRDEAVEACPPSISYRLSKYVRRHKTYVVAASLAITTLFVAMAVASWGWKQAITAAIDVRRSLDEVTKERDAKNKALTERSAALAQEAAQREQAERRLIEGILCRIGYEPRPTAVELDAFREWSLISENRLKTRVLQVAFEDPATALLLAKRSELVAQACVGLSPDRRSMSLEFLLKQQQATPADPRLSLAAVWLSVQLSGSNLPGLDAAYSQLRNGTLESAQSESHQNGVRDSFAFLLLLSNRLGGLREEDKRNSIREMLTVLESHNRNALYWDTTAAICVASSHLSEAELDRGWWAIIEAVERSEETVHISTQESALRALADQLSPMQVSTNAKRHLQQLQQRQDQHTIRAAVAGLTALRTRLPQDLINSGWVAVCACEDAKGIYAFAEMLDHQKLLELLEEYSKADASVRVPAIQLTAAGHSLALSAGSLEQSIASKACGELFGVLLRSKCSHEFYGLEDTIIRLLPYVDRKVRGTCADRLCLSMKEQFGTNGYADLVYCELLESFVPDLTPLQTLAMSQILRSHLLNTFPEHPSSATTMVSVTEKLARKNPAHKIERIFGLIDEMREFTPDDMKLKRLVRVAGEKFWQQGYVLETLLSDSRLVDVDQLFDLMGRIRFHKNEGPDPMTHFRDPLSLDPFTVPDSSVHYRAGDQCALLEWQLSAESVLILMEKSLQVGWLNEQRVAALAAKSAIPEIPPSDLSDLADLLIKLFEQSQSDEAKCLAAEALEKLSPSLSPQQKARAVSIIRRQIGLTGDSSHVRRLGPAIVLIRGAVNLPEDIRTGQVLLQAARRTNVDNSTELAALFRDVEPSQYQSIAAQELISCMDEGLMTAPRAREVMGESRGILPTIRFSNDPRALARMLQHPGCVGRWRECVILRMEELLFHNGERVFLPLTPETDENGDEKQELVIPNELIKTANAPHRRFRSASDVSDWIEKHWPDFDLDATHPVTRRVEQ